MNAELIMALVVVNLILGVWALVGVVQSSERSRYRYRMWQIRDEVVDKITRGDLEVDKAVLTWVEDTELLIEATDWLTPFRYSQASRTHRKLGLSLNPPDPVPTSIAVRKYLESMTAQARAARMRLLFFGSSSGWLLAACAPVLARTVAKASLSHLRDEDRAQRAQGEEDGLEHPVAEAVRLWSSQKFGSPVAVLSDVASSDCNVPAYA